MHQGQLGGFNHLFTAQGCLYQPLQLALGIQHVHLHGQQNRLRTLSTLTSTSSLSQALIRSNRIGMAKSRVCKVGGGWFGMGGRQQEAPLRGQRG